MIKSNLGRLLAAGLLLLCVGAPTRAQGIEEGTADTIPWSGWWWPAKTGNLVNGYRAGEPGALVKHDQVSGKKAANWEQSTYYHYSPTAADWWGHCHSWASASILEKQPLHDVFNGGVVFHVGDLKGLLTEAHYSDRAQFWGRRFTGAAGDDPQDMSPFLVWSVLRKTIRQDKTGVIFDLNAGVQVWNYPCYRYRVAFQPLSNGNYQGQLIMWVGSFQVHPDFVGTVSDQHSYSFTFQANGTQLVAGSDHWTGPSVADHPDFAWYPTQRGQDNPQVDYNLVSQLNLQAH